MQSLGFRGGLKGCEKQLGLERGNLEGVDGYMAVQLWEKYQQSGSQKVLDTLLSYNVQDTIILEHLLATAYNMKLRGTPFSAMLQVPEPVLPDNPFQADVETIDSLKRERRNGFGFGGNGCEDYRNVLITNSKENVDFVEIVTCWG